MSVLISMRFKVSTRLPCGVAGRSQSFETVTCCLCKLPGYGPGVPVKQGGSRNVAVLGMYIDRPGVPEFRFVVFVASLDDGFRLGRAHVSKDAKLGAAPSKHVVNVADPAEWRRQVPPRCITFARASKRHTGVRFTATSKFASLFLLFRARRRLPCWVPFE